MRSNGWTNLNNETAKCCLSCNLFYISVLRDNCFAINFLPSFKGFSIWLPLAFQRSFILEAYCDSHTYIMYTLSNTLHSSSLKILLSDSTKLLFFSIVYMSSFVFNRLQRKHMYKVLIFAILTRATIFQYCNYFLTLLLKMFRYRRANLKAIS